MTTLKHKACFSVKLVQSRISFLKLSEFTTSYIMNCTMNHLLLRSFVSLILDWFVNNLNSCFTVEKAQEKILKNNQGSCQHYQYLTLIPICQRNRFHTLNTIHIMKSVNSNG